MSEGETKQATVETGDTPYDLGYDPFEYDCYDDYRDAVNRLVDAINNTREP